MYCNVSFSRERLQVFFAVLLREDDREYDERRTV